MKTASVLARKAATATRWSSLDIVETMLTASASRPMARSAINARLMFSLIALYASTGPDAIRLAKARQPASYSASAKTRLTMPIAAASVAEMRSLKT